MYRKATSDAMFRLTSSRQSIYLNGTVSESPTGRRRSFSQQKQYKWPTSIQPTPYEIMGLQRGSKSIKSRYYDLVKVYHPDSTMSPMAAQLPKEERVARYRLIVDAYNILSNDQKRSAYDTYGLGWTGPSKNRAFRPESQQDMRYEGWNNDGFNYEAEREFLKHLSSNRKFICFVLVLVIFAQTCVFLSSQAKAELQMRRTDEQCRELMSRSRDRALSLRTLMAQMERLLLKRDPSGTGLVPTEGPFYREMLPFCAY